MPKLTHFVRLTRGAAVGIIVGSIVGVMIILAGIVAVCVCRRRTAVVNEVRDVPATEATAASTAAPTTARSGGLFGLFRKKDTVQNEPVMAETRSVKSIESSVVSGRYHHAVV